MRRACLVALLACAAISCVSASRILENDASGFGRALLQASDPDSLYSCSKYCAPNSCIRVGTTGLVKCNKCVGAMKPLLTGAKRGQCGCPAGTYFKYNADATQATCEICPFGSYCYNKMTFVTNNALNNLGATPCGDNLTTRTKRATSVWDCVNMGGYRLLLSGSAPAAELCTGNTYAIAKSKQTKCTACASGFEIVDPIPASPAAGDHDAAADCLVPPGYFLKSPGQIAPCDQGSYQPKYLKQSLATVGVCTPCPEGVTTLLHGSTAQADCKKLKPGYVATAVGTSGITTAALCPQGYYCPGDVLSDPNNNAGAVTISTLTYDSGTKLLTGTGYIVSVTGTLTLTGAGAAKMERCPNNAWTKALGATNVDECLIPPGFEKNGADIRLCQTNKYRQTWVARTSTAACTACGENIQAEAIEPLTLYSAVDTTDYTEVNLRVKASSKSCYIEKGQGMYYVTSPTGFVYKARECGSGNAGAVANSYGVNAAKVFGLAQMPCKICPAGTVVTTDATKQLTTKVTGGGYYHPLACVTQVGYGWDGRVATQCPRGWYNAGDNYEACKQCSYGLTTLNPGAADDTLCLLAPGFGTYESKVMLCPAGTYGDDVRALDQTCKACSGSGQGTNSYTEEEGSDAPTDCNVCAPGYGGDTLAACAACGGNTPDGTYGPTGRSSSELSCVLCPESDVGFLFYYQDTPYYYKSKPRAPTGATDPAQCVSAMAQIDDSYWYLSGAGDTVTGKTSTEACATHCLGQEDCMFMTYDFAAAGEKCSIRKATGTAVSTIITAMKAVPSSDVGQRRKLLAGAKPKAISTGLYTQWKEDGSNIGVQVPSAASDAAIEVCFDACTDDEACAGVVWNPSAGAGLKCSLIHGVNDVQGVDVAKRSLTRAKPDNFATAWAAP